MVSNKINKYREVYASAQMTAVSMFEHFIALNNTV